MITVENKDETNDSGVVFINDLEGVNNDIRWKWIRRI
jgi:hypothetical protein